MRRCCHRPGQCYLPDKEFRYLRHVVSLMSPSRSDYIFTTQVEWVWRVVSEDSTNRTLEVFPADWLHCPDCHHIHQRRGTGRYSAVPAFSQILERPLAVALAISTVHTLRANMLLARGSRRQPGFGPGCFLHIAMQLGLYHPPEESLGPGVQSLRILLPQTTQ